MESQAQRAHRENRVADVTVQRRIIRNAGCDYSHCRRRGTRGRRGEKARLTLSRWHACYELVEVKVEQGAGVCDRRLQAGWGEVFIDSCRILRSEEINLRRQSASGIQPSGSRTASQGNASSSREGVSLREFADEPEKSFR